MQNENLPEKHYTPLPFIETKTAKELLKIRKDIESNEQHRGANFELVLDAYSQVRKFHGHPIPKKDACRSGCIAQMNKILSNWFKQYDGFGGVLPQDKGDLAAARATVGIAKNGELVPVDERRAELEKKPYKELVSMLGEDKVKDLNNGKAPKKNQVIDELMKL